MSDKLLLINPQTENFYMGSNALEIIEQVAWIARGERRLVIHDKDDTVSFSSEFTDDELVSEMAKRAVEVMIKRYGYMLYVRKD